VKIYLVRHAKAETRKEWRGDAQLRPLGAEGRAQAQALARHLEGVALARIVTSPTLCCQQTVEPLTLASDVPVDVDERLADGESVRRALELFPTWNEGPVLFCAHADLVLSLLRLFELPEVESEEEIPRRRGSVWLLEGPGYTPTTAHYFEPDPSSPRAEVVLPRSVRAATLDLGSTSFNLLIAEVSHKGRIRPVVREKVMLRLGAVIATESIIPEEVCARAVAVARELRVVAEQEKAQHLFPVATSALREARNGDELADRIGRSLGTPVRILSGEEEARLMFQAFARRVDIEDGTALGLDLGGGSLELAVGRRDGVDLELTLPLGVARLHQEFVRHDPMRKSELRRIRERIEELLAPHLEALRKAKPKRVIATGGSVRGLARLVAEKRADRNARVLWPMEISTRALGGVSAGLARSSHEERLGMRGMRKDRSDLLPTGGIVLVALAELLDIDRMTICDWGLREGVMLDALVLAPR
jgi:exopolyphosphatase/guanosine-5'-triphosphate,3'-diphosphate pyrophosphatase